MRKVVNAHGKNSNPTKKWYSPIKHPSPFIPLPKRHTLFKKTFIHFRERGGGRETSTCEKNIDCLPPVHAPTWDGTCNLGPGRRIGSPTFCCAGRCSKHLRHTSQGKATTLHSLSPVFVKILCFPFFKIQRLYISLYTFVLFTCYMCI